MNIIITKKALKYFLIGFFSLLIITTLQFLTRYTEDVFDKGFSLGYIMKLILHLSVTLIGISLLFGILIATIFSFRFYSKNQVINFKKDVISGTMIIIGFALLLFCFSNWIVPKSKIEMYSILYEMKSTAPGDEVESVDRNIFTSNQAMLTIKEICLKVDTLDSHLKEYKSQCDSILRILPDSIAYEKYEKLGLEEFGLNYYSTKNEKLIGREAKRASYRLQSSFRKLKRTISEKQEFTKEMSTRIVLPITLILLYIIGASFGFLYNDQKAFLLVILALYTIMFFFKNELLIVNNLFINANNTIYSIIALVVVTSIFLIKGLRKKQEITQPNNG